MPQQPQQPRVTDKELIINGQVYPPGTPLSIVRAAGGDPATGASISSGGRAMLTPPDPVDAPSRRQQIFNNPNQGATFSGGPRDLRSSHQVVKDIASTSGDILGDIITLVSSIRGGTLPARWLGAGAGGAVSAYSRGDDPVTGFRNQAALEGITGGFLPKGTIASARRLVGAAEKPLGFTGNIIEGGLGDAIPYAGHNTAMMLAGVKGDTREVANAAVRLRRPVGKNERFSRSGPSLGDTAGIKKEIGVQGKKLEKAETGSTARVSPAAFENTASNRAANDLLPGLDSIDNLATLKNTEKDFVRDQTAQLGAAHFGKDLPNFTSKEATHFQNVRHSPQGERVLDALAPHVELNMRQLGDIRRRTGKDAENILRARSMGNYVDPAANMDATSGEALHSFAKRLQDTLNPEVIPINKKFADLFNFLEASETAKGARSMLGTPGEMGARGGLGHGVMSNVAGITHGAGTLSKWAGPGAILFAAPRTLSSLGNKAGTLAEFAPTIMRGKDLSEDIKELIRQIQDKDKPQHASATSGVSFRKP